jgi:hypothetical protein
VTDTFRTLSDLIADAEDLLGRLDGSTSPEIRRLKQRVDSSIRDMRDRFKQRVKAAHRPMRPWAGGIMNPWVPTTAATLVALGLLYVVFARDER